MTARTIVLAGIVLSLFAAGGRAQGYRTTDPRRERVEQQQKDNKEWEEEAKRAESELYRRGERFLSDKDFVRAAQAFREVTSMTYEQWDIREIAIGGARSLQPATRKIRRKLNTATTRRAQDRLKTMGPLVAAEELKQFQAQAKEHFERADAAMTRKNPAEAYAIYGKIIEAAERLGQNKAAIEESQKAEAKRKEILAAANAALDEIEKMGEGASAADVKARIAEFNENHGPMLEVSRDLKERLKALSNSPQIQKANREQDVQNRIFMGDAAILREDYIGAMRHYRFAITNYADTEGVRVAIEKLTRLQSDPKAQEAVKQFEVDVQAQALMQQARSFHEKGRIDEARGLYERVLAAYPNTTWAEQAAEGLRKLSAQ